MKNKVEKYNEKYLGKVFSSIYNKNVYTFGKITDEDLELVSICWDLCHNGIVYELSDVFYYIEKGIWCDIKDKE